MEWHEIHDLKTLKNTEFTERQKICLSVASMLTKISDEATMIFFIGLYGGDAFKALSVYRGMHSYSEVAEIIDLTLTDDNLSMTGAILMSMLEMDHKIAG